MNGNTVFEAGFRIILSSPTRYLYLDHTYSSRERRMNRCMTWRALQINELEMLNDEHGRHEDAG